MTDSAQEIDTSSNSALKAPVDVIPGRKRQLLVVPLVSLIVVIVSLFFYLLLYQPQLMVFVPKSLRDYVVMVALKTTLPKTSEQIMLLSSEKLPEIDTFSQRLFAEMKFDSGDYLRVRVDGAVRVSPFEFSEEATFSGSWAGLVEDGQISLNARLLDDSYFLKFEKITDVILQKYFGKVSITGLWYEIIDEAPSGNELMVTAIQEVIAGIGNPNELSSVESTEINSEEVYHLDFQLVPEHLRGVLEQNLGGIIPNAPSFIEEIKAIEIEMWIDQITYTPYRIVVRLEGKIPSGVQNVELEGRLVEFSQYEGEPYSLEIGLELENINQPQGIVSPMNPLPWSAFEEELHLGQLKNYVSEFSELLEEYYAINEFYPRSIAELIENPEIVEQLETFQSEQEVSYSYLMVDDGPNLVLWKGYELTEVTKLLLYSHFEGSINEITLLDYEVILQALTNSND